MNCVLTLEWLSFIKLYLFIFPRIYHSSYNPIHFIKFVLSYKIFNALRLEPRASKKIIKKHKNGYRLLCLSEFASVFFTFKSESMNFNICTCEGKTPGGPLMFRKLNSFSQKIKKVYIRKEAESEI
jgi:hypothetical protein